MLELVRNGFELCSNSSVDEFEQPELSPNSSVDEFVLCSNSSGTGSGCGRTPSLPEVELVHKTVPVRGLRAQSTSERAQSSSSGSWVRAHARQRAA